MLVCIICIIIHIYMYLYICTCINMKMMYMYMHTASKIVDRIFIAHNYMAIIIMVQPLDAKTKKELETVLKGFLEPKQVLKLDTKVGLCRCVCTCTMVRV